MRTKDTIRAQIERIAEGVAFGTAYFVVVRPMVGEHTQSEGLLNAFLPGTTNTDVSFYGMRERFLCMRTLV